MRILIADDSNVIKKLILQEISKSNECEVIDTACDGLEAYKKTLFSRPDIVVMDLNMPVLNGIESIKMIMSNCPTPVIVLTSVEDPEISKKALKAGAVSIIKKPKGFDYKNNIEKLIKDILVFGKKNQNIKTVNNNFDFYLEKFVPEIICVGASTGGPNALAKFLSGLTTPVNIPIIIIQHITEDYGRALAKWLSPYTKMPVKVPQNYEKIMNGVIYLPDNGSHLIVTKDKKLLNSKNKLHPFICPSIDVTFESVVNVFKTGIIGIILTGMGKDGAEGMEKIYLANGYTLVQDKEDCVVFGMPKASIDKQVVRKIMHIDNIGSHIFDLVKNL
jgi:two-component system chemotaxis response regulator CheB